MRDSGFEGIEHWHSKVQIFKKRVLWMPYHEGLHWSAVVVVNPAGLLTEAIETECTLWKDHAFVGHLDPLGVSLSTSLLSIKFVGHHQISPRLLPSDILHYQ